MMLPTVNHSNVQTAVAHTGFILTQFAANAGIALDFADQLLRFTQLHQFYVWLDDMLAEKLKLATGTERGELLQQKRVAARRRVKYEAAVDVIRELVEKPLPEFAAPHLVAWAGEVV